MLIKTVTYHATILKWVHFIHTFFYYKNILSQTVTAIPALHPLTIPDALF